MKLSIFATFLAVASVFAYFIFTFLFQKFFENKFSRPRFSFWHIAISLGFFMLCMILMHEIPDPELSNRFQHAFGGGTAVMIVIFCSYLASGVKTTRFQFFIFSFLLASFCGIANELVEYIAQNYMNLMFAPDPNDTWLDLYANTFGILIGNIIFAVFPRRFYKK